MSDAEAKQAHPKPFVFFDLGETLVELRPLLACLAELVRSKFPPLRDGAEDFAVSWIVASADRMPRDPGEPFQTEHRVASRVLREMLSSRGVVLTTDEAGLLLRGAWDRYENQVVMCSDASIDFLADVRRLSAAVGLVTDGDSENVHRLLVRLSLEDMFDSITMSEEVRAYKPNPLIYRSALESVRADPGRSLFISDTALDVRGALNVGMAAGIVHRGPLSDRGGVPGEAIRLASLRDVLTLLKNFAMTGRFRI